MPIIFKKFNSNNIFGKVKMMSSIKMSISKKVTEGIKTD